MKAGYCVGRKTDGTIAHSKRFLMMEEFMQENSITNSADVLIFDGVEISEYVYKFFILNKPDLKKDMRENMFMCQGQIIDDFNNGKPIRKYVQEELFEKVEERKIEIVKTTNTSSDKKHETLAEVATIGKVLTNHEEFLLGGKARFTIRNIITKNRVTFRVKMAKKRRISDNFVYYFVSVLSGTDNNTNYTYIGMLKTGENVREFYLTKGSKVTKEAVSVKVFTWLIKNINRLNLFPSMEFFHEGYCARCGRLLTVPESIKTGFGPECVRIRSRIARAVNQ